MRDRIGPDFITGNCPLTDTWNFLSGRFQIDGVPSGNVKVVIAGRTATAPPASYYFPEMAMDAQMQPGQNNFVMKSMESIRSRVVQSR